MERLLTWQLDFTFLGAVQVTQGPVKGPLVVIEFKELRIVFASDINYDVTFRELLWIPSPDNLGIFKPEQMKIVNNALQCQMFKC